MKKDWYAWEKQVILIFLKMHTQILTTMKNSKLSSGLYDLEYEAWDKNSDY